MASKTAAARRASNKRRKAIAKRRKALAALKISKKARTEVAKLLKHDKAGTITRAKLETGLKEVKGGLTRMLHFVRSSL